MFAKTPRHDAAALQHELRLGAQEQCTHLEHPPCGRQSNPNAIRVAQDAHELLVGHRVRGGDVDDAVDLIVRNQPAHGADEILLVDPRHELPAVSDRPALPATDEREQRIEDTSPIRSLRTLGPHRVTLRALVPVMVGDVDEGVFARSTAFSRKRVQAVFRAAVGDASDAPTPKLADALGRLLNLIHLGVILWWLLDKSPGQRATQGLLSLWRKMLPPATLAMRVPMVRGAIQSADMLFREALLDGLEPEF